MYFHTLFLADVLDEFLSRASLFFSSFAVTSSDVRMATMAVARIQHVYRKDSFAMASQGQLPTTAQGSVQELALAQSKARLSAEDAMYVADCLLDSDLNKRGLCCLWMSLENID